MSNVQCFAFEGKQIRFVQDPSGKHEFGVVGADLKQPLGYHSRSHMFYHHAPEEYRELMWIDADGKALKVTVIWGAGVEKLLDKTQSANSQLVKKWLKDEVVPSLKQDKKHTNWKPLSLLESGLPDEDLPETPAPLPALSGESPLSELPDLVIERRGETLVIDSRLVSARLGIEHRALIQTIKTHEGKIEERFGVVTFEMSKPPAGSLGGRPEKFAFLTEDQALFIGTLSRNSERVVDFKADLV
jgi:hypothetical protein